MRRCASAMNVEILVIVVAARNIFVVVVVNKDKNTSNKIRNRIFMKRFLFDFLVQIVQRFFMRRGYVFSFSRGLIFCLIVQLFF